MNMKLAWAAVAVAGVLTSPAFAEDKTKARGPRELHQSMMSGMEKMHDMKMSGDTDHERGARGWF